MNRMARIVPDPNRTYADTRTAVQLCGSHGLEFDLTDVGALKSTKTWTFVVAEAVYRCPQWSYQTNVDSKRNQILIFVLQFIWKKRYRWVSQNQ